ncbi:hypothetical protein [Streptomyces sp. ISL-11]|uniref:hypothetical protein n=1 Tax=Streptomyces sp. ISL-11 TaxID=2819174 RepID=UPI001BE61E16|nr:hypothetical protein [Streptomyces sp. ISL-11]MBT2382995.1 hypothetical protein [Streptomyces sp. ISL-11]
MAVNGRGTKGNSPRWKLTPTSVGATFGSVTAGVSGAYVTTGSVLVTCVAGGLGLLVVVMLLAVFLLAR